MNIEHLKPLADLLAIDPQDDCDCLVEVYEGLGGGSIYLDKFGKHVFRNFGIRTVLPMLESLSYFQLETLFLASFLAASEEPTRDLIYTTMLCSPHANIDRVFLGKHGMVFYENRAMRVIELNDLHPNSIMLLPEPEFVGCLTWNKSYIGAFVMPGAIVKKELNANV